MIFGTSNFFTANEEIMENLAGKYETLFLDRDGVINKHIPDGYVKNWDEFEFLPGVLEAFEILSVYFKTIVIVTNQRGVGKRLMTEDELINIHERMTSEIRQYGGRIDKIYYCTDINMDNPNRKPNSGMALQAKNDFPCIEFKESIMIGDGQSDIEFGNRLGMKTVLINDSERKDGLLEFALSLPQK